MMKKIYLSLLCIGISMMLAQSVFAQTDFLEILRSDAQTDVKVLITEGMNLTEVQSEKFWPIYDGYMTEMKKINNSLFAMIKDYKESYEAMTDDKANELASKLLALKADRLKLQKTYYGKMKKELGAFISVRFLQISNRIIAIVDLTLAERVPLAF